MKILLLDIETSPHLSWHFQRRKVTIPRKHTEQESRIICWAAKWYGQKTIHCRAAWDESFEEMMERLWALMDEADVIVGFNSKKFDVRRINSEFLRMGISQPSPYDQVDLYREITKHFAFSANRLDDILEELGMETKYSNSGMDLWVNVMHGDVSARAEMKRYNKQDVKVTEELYDRIKGWITTHPNWGLFIDDENPVCTNCGSSHVIKHKERRTRTRRYTQYQCQDCGAYARGRKSIPVTQGVLT